MGRICHLPDGNIILCLCDLFGRPYFRAVITAHRPRLERAFPAFDAPLFFVTFRPLPQKKIEPIDVANAAFLQYARRARDEYNVAVGRYLMMPDHVDLFVQGAQCFHLDTWVAGLKRTISVSLGATCLKPLWQPGCFDQLVVSKGGYAEMWECVRANPVRRGLVASTEEWEFQGEVVVIDRFELNRPEGMKNAHLGREGRIEQATTPNQWRASPLLHLAHVRQKRREQADERQKGTDVEDVFDAGAIGQLAEDSGTDSGHPKG